jgi:hypothetical protein
VNKLPPEILSHIARHIPHERATNAESIMPLTQVCRYWRECITSNPEHWTLVSNYSPRIGLAALSLERAKTARLGVEIDMGSFREEPESFRLIIPYIQNIDTLGVDEISDIKELDQVLPDFPRSTPNLRSLALSQYFDTNADLQWDRSIDPFKSLAPTLRYLKLNDIPLYSSFLRLRALTELDLVNRWFDLHLDTLLDFLEENRSLERVTLRIEFTEPSLRISPRRAAIRNRLQRLAIHFADVIDGQALISSIALQRGAHLEISSLHQRVGFNEVLSGISTAHLLNLRSSTFMEYRPSRGDIQLTGPNGTFSFSGFPSPEGHVVTFPPLPLIGIREFRLIHEWEPESTTGPPVFHPPSFPALETLVIHCKSNVSRILSALFSNPSSSPSLKTLAFLNCYLSDDFMEELVQFALDRMDTTLTSLHHVVIVNSGGRFPSTDWLDQLEGHVPIVDVRRDKKLPADMTQCLKNVPSSTFRVY